MKKANIIYSDKGSIAVEASLTVPIIVFCILALIYFGMILYQRVYLQAVVDIASERAVSTWDSTRKDFITGKVSKNDLGTDGIYWRIIDTNKGIKENKVLNYICSSLRYEGKNPHGVLISAQNPDNGTEVNLTNYIIYKKLDVAVKESYRIPIGSITKVFGINDGYKMEAYSTSVVNEPEEFIRNLDFICDLEKRLERRYPGFGNSIQKIRDAVGSIKENISKFFN